ncbi:hypothetical protein SNE40_018016 [Patella caerulea]|uniref:Fibrinogen C-terminal domain-containing protein n=1 Tax=Patella caerulea TaxID=87958 RepID=A0AAN8J7L4_PATCE
MDVLRLVIVLGFTKTSLADYKYKSPKLCEHQLTVPTATAYKSLTVDWLLDCVRQCSHDSSCLSATFDGSQTCYMFPANDRNCSVPLQLGGSYFLKESITCLNNGTLNTTTHTCKCYNGYIGDKCQRIMMDCTEGFYSGHYKTDEFSEYLIKPTLAPQPFYVECYMKDIGGATVIMMNSKWSPFLDRTLNWENYTEGFGTPIANHWIGLHNMNYITNSRPQHLFVEVISGLDWEARWRKYENFKVEDESTNYRMTYSGSFPWTQTEVGADPDWSKVIASTPLGDSMIGLNGSAFSTFDRDNDLDVGRNCAREYQGGWWYNACADCNPNSPIDEVFWKYDFINYEIAYIEMLLKAT